MKTTVENAPRTGEAPKLYMDGTKLDRHLEEVVAWRRGDWIAPIHLEISLTKVCNQHCTFCYIDWSHGAVQMDEEVAINLIKDAKRLGVKSALIAGEGEPTINKAYAKVIETAGEVGFDVALNSNAVLMTDEQIERFIPNLSWMRCSVQAADPKTYAAIHKAPENHFGKAIRNIEKCVETKHKTNSKLAIGVQQVLIQENGHTVAELARLAKEMGADYYVIKPCHPHDMNKQSYKTISDLVEMFSEQLEEAQSLSDDNFKAVVRWNFLAEAEKPRNYTKCLALPFIVQIGADGSLYTCYAWGHDKDHVYGNLNEKSFEEIIKSEEYRKIWTSVGHNKDLSKCMPTCRHHNANKYLWHLTEEVPDHLNFI